MARKIIGKRKPQKTVRAAAAPSVKSFTDVGSQTANQLLTPGVIAGISGDDPKFDPANPDEGIFFIGSDGTEHKVHSIARRTKIALTVSVPGTLTPGSYKLEVRKGHGTITRTIRKGLLERRLTVLQLRNFKSAVLSEIL